MEYHDHKITAREKLYGNWKLAVGVSFVAALLGGIISGGNIDLTFGLDSEDLHTMPRFVISYLQVVAPIALAMGIVQFIAGGMIRLGYCRFLLKLYDGEEAKLEDLFSQTHRFRDGFCRSLFIIPLLIFRPFESGCWDLFGCILKLFYPLCPLPIFDWGGFPSA